MDYIKFSLDSNGLITYIDGSESEQDLEKIQDLINLLVRDNKILLGTKTEGTIDFGIDSFSVNHKVCIPIGGFDSWDEMFTLQNNSDYGL